MKENKWKKHLHVDKRTYVINYTAFTLIFAVSLLTALIRWLELKTGQQFLFSTLVPPGIIYLAIVTFIGYYTAQKSYEDYCGMIKTAELKHLVIALIIFISIVILKLWLLLPLFIE
jgi:hypothetical protein